MRPANSLESTQISTRRQGFQAVAWLTFCRRSTPAAQIRIVPAAPFNQTNRHVSAVVLYTLTSQSSSQLQLPKIVSNCSATVFVCISPNRPSRSSFAEHRPWKWIQCALIDPIPISTVFDTTMEYLLFAAVQVNRLHLFSLFFVNIILLYYFVIVVNSVSSIYCAE